MSACWGRLRLQVRRHPLLVLLLCLLLLALLMVEDVTWQVRSASLLVWARYHEKFNPAPELNITDNEKVILFWTPFFGTMQFKVGYGRYPFRGCPVSNCVTTNQRQYLRRAGAVFFHPVEFSDFDLPAWRSPDQIWVFYLLESPEYTKAKFTDATRGLFNATFTYRRDSDFYQPYFRMERIPEGEQRVTVEPSVSPTPAQWKTRLPWVVSHCSTKGGRELYAKELNKYISVDIYGRCGKLQCSELPGMFYQVNPHTCYERLHRDHQFYLSFENSRCIDYITEKFFVALNHSLVPIVYGARREDYAAIAPADSFIHVDDYGGPQELADHVRSLMSNETRLRRYTEWRGKWRVVGGGREGWCQLCERLNSESGGHSSYPDIDAWWRGSDEAGHVCS